MRVRLLTRWGSRFQGDIVSVSDERAKAMQEAGFAKILDDPAAVEPEDAGGEDLASVKAELDRLGVSYDRRIGLAKAKALLAEALNDQ